MRQQYDTKYAALYHPWLLIPDPYPATSRSSASSRSRRPATCWASTPAPTTSAACTRRRRTRSCAASSGCQRYLNKGEQDILNPYPGEHQRHPRLPPEQPRASGCGARACITSDADWKYVNVRRLLIFIEESIDRGLQWVVFEPNAEPLWARVRRSDHRTSSPTVWRNGALEGTKPEEGVLRQVRPHDDDARRHRQRPADRA